MDLRADLGNRHHRSERGGEVGYKGQADNNPDQGEESSSQALHLLVIAGASQKDGSGPPHCLGDSVKVTLRKMRGLFIPVNDPDDMRSYQKSQNHEGGQIKDP